MKTSLWIASVAIVGFAACSGDSSTQPAGTSPGQEEPAVVEEELPTAEEAAAQASQSIDEANADAELKRLEDELGDG
jgi:hypothetical protein